MSGNSYNDPNWTFSGGGGSRQHFLVKIIRTEKRGVYDPSLREGIPSVFLCEKLNGDQAFAECYFWTVPGHEYGGSRQWSLDPGNIWVAKDHYRYSEYFLMWNLRLQSHSRWMLVAPSGVPAAYWDDPNLEEVY